MKMNKQDIVRMLVEKERVEKEYQTYLSTLEDGSVEMGATRDSPTTETRHDNGRGKGRGAVRRRPLKDCSSRVSPEEG